MTARDPRAQRAAPALLYTSDQGGALLCYDHAERCRTTAPLLQ